VKTILIIFIGFCFHVNTFAQKQKAKNYFETHIGLSVGKETMLALPRVDFNYFVPKKTITPYLGGHAGLWFLFSFSFTTSFRGGIQYKVFTLDNAISFNNYNAERISFNTLSLNPKCGIKYKGIWLKAGPSKNIFSSGTEPFAPINFNIDLILKIDSDGIFSGHFRY
jgi:hypothetical protein